MPRLKPIAQARGAEFGGLLAGALVGNGFVLLMLGALLSRAQPQGSWGLTLAIAGVFIAGGLALLYAAVRAGRRMLAVRRVLGPAEVIRPDKPIYAGEEFRLIYRRSFLREAEVNSIRVSLIRRDSGTGAPGVMVGAPASFIALQSEESTPGRLAAGADFTAHYRFSVPLADVDADGIPTRRVGWLIHVQTHLAGWPPVDEDYMLPVRVVGSAYVG